MANDDDNFDDEPTPPERKSRPRHRAETATERDLKGLSARAARHAAAEASMESERTRQHKERMAACAHPREVPIPADMVERELGGPGEIIDPEPTKPWAMLDRDELNDDELEILHRSRRESDSPATYKDIIKVSAKQAKYIKALLDDRSARKESADAVIELIKHPPHEAVLTLQAEVRELQDENAALRSEITEIRPVFKTVQRLAYWAFGVAGTVLVAVGVFLYTRGFSEGSATTRADRMERDVQEIRQDVRQLQQRHSAPKGNEP